MRVAPDLRPRTVGEVLDAAFFVYRRYFGRLLMVATLISIPTLVVAGLIAEASTEALVDYFVQSLENPNPNIVEGFAEILDRAQRLNFYSTISYMAQALARGGAYATMAIAGWAAIRRAPMPGVMALVRGSLPRIPAIVASQVAVTVLASILACCPPLMIIALVLLAPLPAAMMLERGPMETGLREYVEGDPESGRTPLPWLAGLPLRCVALPGAMIVDGLVRSVTLSWHGFTVARGTLFLGFLLCFVTFFVGAVSGTVALFLDSLAAAFWLQHYAEVMVLPILGLGTTFWYFDLRTRREGLDLLADPEAAL